MLKKIVLLAFLCLPLGMMAEEVKIAHVNTQDIFTAMPETAAAESELATLNQKITSDLQSMQDEYNKKYTDFMQASDTLVQSIKVRRMQEIEDLKTRIETAYQQGDQDMAKRKSELQAPIIQKIQDAIKAVGDEQGYTYIMEAGAFMYISSKAVDATPLVKAKLGLK